MLTHPFAALYRCCLPASARIRHCLWWCGGLGQLCCGAGDVDCSDRSADNGAFDSGRRAKSVFGKSIRDVSVRCHFSYLAHHVKEVLQEQRLIFLTVSGAHPGRRCRSPALCVWLSCPAGDLPERREWERGPSPAATRFRAACSWVDSCTILGFHAGLLKTPHYPVVELGVGEAREHNKRLPLKIL